MLLPCAGFRTRKHGQLRKEERPSRVSELCLAAVRTTSVEAPIPQREDKNIRHPDRSGRHKQRRRSFLAGRKRGDQPEHGGHEFAGHDGRDREPEPPVQPMMPRAVKHESRDQQYADDGGKQPTWPQRETARQGEEQARDGYHRDQRRPARLAPSAASFRPGCPTRRRALMPFHRFLSPRARHGRCEGNATRQRPTTRKPTRLPLLNAHVIERAVVLARVLWLVTARPPYTICAI